MRISDWSSDVCSSDLPDRSGHADRPGSPDAYRNGVADLAGGTGWRDPRARLGARRQELYRPAPQARARLTPSRGQTGGSGAAYRRMIASMAKERRRTRSDRKDGGVGKRVAGRGELRGGRRLT